MPKKSVKKATGKAVTKKAVKKSVVKKVVKKAVTKAGRPKGTGKYGCVTTAVRIPIHLEDDVHTFVTKKIRAETKQP